MASKFASVHVTWTSLSQLVACFDNNTNHCLSHDELIRATAFLRSEDRLFYVVRRHWVRNQLALWLDQRPEEIAIGLDPFGKPYIEGESLAFNTSTSNKRTLLVAGDVDTIGCDLEYCDAEFPFRPVMAFFSSTERAALDCLEPSLKRLAFYHTWTCKEAYLKAIGAGLSRGLETFDVAVNPTQPARLLSGCEGFSAQSFDLEGGYRGAIVARGEWAFTLSSQQS